MTRLFRLLTTLLLTLAIAACGGSGSGSPEATTDLGDEPAIQTPATTDEGIPEETEESVPEETEEAPAAP